ncbi:hypothetical protein [Echinimonas agarilytica]|uniref:Pullulanase n=1 Tax=Echinimonas agarilytica TaxID=1215918 RepID=A0AA41W3Q5_9GAMM|nr:hypothetical protein [Echinimonas agarilytica]MCM2678078.1 hypothetical protein [Echinimonas agarilytica]
MISLVNRIAVVVSILLLQGCQTTAKKPAPPPPPVKPDLSAVMYLRAVFTWWDAEEPFKVVRVSDDLYRSQTKLVADGEYYDFKFADASWSSGMNCGYLTEADEIVIDNGAPVNANCNSAGSYFRFKPKRTGVFYFYFDNRGDQPKVYIERK